MTATVLVTGGSGQVGAALARLAPPDWTLVAPTRAELDITDDAAVARLVAARPWSAIVNAAAYTAVDRAESEPDAAWAANATAPGVLARAAAEVRVPLIHLSTDYVFDGTKPAAYVEDDPVAPISVYGASKEGGEAAVRSAGGRHVILRTAWVVSPDGTNFIKTMLRLGAQGGPLRVVADQIGCPTTAADIAAAIIAVTRRLIADPAAPSGTYHFVSSGEATWFAFARAIFALAEAHGRPPVTVHPITTAEYPTPARRPANSRLATGKLTRDYGVRPRPWREAVAEVVEVLVT